jgi:hypothetical protein
MSILAVATLYFLGFYANDLLFSNLEHHRGAHWIFLPAGLRLLGILLLGSIGAIGIFLGSLVASLIMSQATPLELIVESRSPQAHLCSPIMRHSAMAYRSI